MSFMQKVKMVNKILSFKLKAEDLCGFAEDKFDKGVALKVGDIVRKINVNNDGYIDLFELGLYLLNKIKKK